jgi:hypothetical protein
MLTFRRPQGPRHLAHLQQRRIGHYVDHKSPRKSIHFDLLQVVQYTSKYLLAKFVVDLLQEGNQAKRLGVLVWRTSAIYYLAP